MPPRAARSDSTQSQPATIRSGNDGPMSRTRISSGLLEATPVRHEGFRNPLSTMSAEKSARASRYSGRLRKTPSTPESFPRRHSKVELPAPSSTSPPGQPECDDLPDGDALYAHYGVFPIYFKSLFILILADVWSPFSREQPRLPEIPMGCYGTPGCPLPGSVFLNCRPRADVPTVWSAS